MSRRVFFRDNEAQGFSTYGLLLDTLFRQLKTVGVAGYFPYEYQEDMRCRYAELVSFFGEEFGRLAEQEGDTSNLSILSKHVSLRGMLLEKYRKDNERYLAARNSLSIKSLKKAEEVNEPSWDKLYASAEAEDARGEEGIKDSGEGKPDSAVVNSFLAAINGAHAVDDSSAPAYVEDDEEPVGGYFSDEDEEYSSELPDDDDEYSSELPDDDDDEYSSELPDDDDEYSSELPDDDDDGDSSELSEDDDEYDEDSSELPEDDEEYGEDSSELPEDDDEYDEDSSELPEDDDEYDEDSSELPDDDEEGYSSELPEDDEDGEDGLSEFPDDDDEGYSSELPEDDDEDSSELPEDDDDEDSSELPADDDDEYDDEDSSELPEDDDDDYDDEDSSELPDDEYDEEDSSELPDDEDSLELPAGYSSNPPAGRAVSKPRVYAAPVVSNMVVRPSYARGIPGRETQEAVLDMMDRLANNIKGWFSRL